MITCQNCGQTNAKQSNFCRFCGLKFAAPVPVRPQTPRPQQPPQPPQSYPRSQQQQEQQPHSFEQNAPRPYSWKTDEFQVKERGVRKTEQIDLNSLDQFGAHNQQTRPLAHRPGNTGITAGYRCPRCATQMPPHATRKVSSAGWIIFTVLIVFFFPLFWVGLLIKEDVHTCPVCDLKVN